MYARRRDASILSKSGPGMNDPADSPEESDRTRAMGSGGSRGPGGPADVPHFGASDPRMSWGIRSRRTEGVIIGGYRLLARLDQDSNNMFGEVWRAQRLDPAQLVAIKFMRPDAVREDLVHRFARKESTALARMRHPYIATFIDFQFDGDDPYLVMEFVPGASPITSYCDRQKLSLRDRLELCAKVCEAVAEVHLAGIIHRDLKPQNILVTEVGGRPVPKLIDFGLARSERPEAPLDPHGASVGSSFMGTRLYASPEQLQELPVERIQRASDVYALGAVLFEALIGTTPMAHVFEDRDMPKARREELLANSARPSLEQALALMTPARRAEVAAARGISVLALRVFARSRARHIVATALRLEPSARFPNASDMADDIRACIDGRDYRHAAQEPWSDRFARSVRRHRVGWASGAIVALALTGTAVVSTSMWLRAEEQRARAERTFSFFDEQFLRRSQAEASDPAVPMVDHVRQAVVALGPTLGRDPVTAARASVTLSRTALSLGDFRLASEALRRGEEVLASSGAGSDTLAAFGADRAAIEAEVTRLSGGAVDCDSTADRINDLLSAGTVAALREARSLAGVLKGADGERCLDIAERAYDTIKERGIRDWPDDLDRLVDMHNLCLVAELRARRKNWPPEACRAAILARGALTQDCRQRLGATHWQTLASEAELARLEWKSGDRTRALDRYRTLVADLTAPGRHLGWREADAIATMALVLKDDGRRAERAEAARLLSVALSVNRAQRPDHGTTEEVVRHLAELLEGLGEIESARAVLQRACRDAEDAKPIDQARRDSRAKAFEEFSKRHPQP